MRSHEFIVETNIVEGPGWDKAKKSIVATGAGIIGASTLISGIGAYNDTNRAEKASKDREEYIAKQSPEAKASAAKMQAELQAELKAIANKSAETHWKLSTHTDPMDGSITKFKSLSTRDATLLIQINPDGTKDSIIETPGKIIKHVSRCKIDNTLEQCGGHAGGDRKNYAFIVRPSGTFTQSLASEFLSAKNEIKVEVYLYGQGATVFTFIP